MNAGTVEYIFETWDNRKGPKPSAINTRRGLTLNQGLVDWRATLNGTRYCACGCGTQVNKTYSKGHNAPARPADPTCTQSDCTRLRRSPGGAYCETHYYRLRRTGSLELRPRGSLNPEAQKARDERNAKMCELYESGLSTTQVAAEVGLDYSQVSRLLRAAGVIMRPFGPAGEASSLWAADRITYSGAHMRLRRERGGAKAHVCGCGRPAKQWAYSHDDPNEKLSPSGPYSTDTSYYVAMCIPCHKRADLSRIAARR